MLLRRQTVEKITREGLGSLPCTHQRGNCYHLQGPLREYIPCAGNKRGDPQLSLSGQPSRSEWPFQEIGPGYKVETTDHRYRKNGGLGVPFEIRFSKK